MAEKVVIGNAELWLGDCQDVLPLVRGVQVLLTDPPYGMAYKSGWSGASVPMDGTRMCLRMYRRLLPLIVQTLADDAHLYWFTRWDVWPDVADIFAPVIPIKNALVWDKGHPGMGDLKSYGYSYEMCAFAATGKRALQGSRPGSVFRYPPVPNIHRLHPTEKPVALLRDWVSRSAATGETVFDPFMGSASSGVAALSVGCRFIGVEIDRKYFDFACRRIEDAQRQAPMRPDFAGQDEQQVMEL
jgi:site-specific DNA-methyltransferase (adenine-specific)